MNLCCAFIYRELQNYWDSDNFVVVLDLYSSTFDEVKVQFVSFNLRVFLFMSGELFRGYSTFCT